MRLIDADALIEFCEERWIPLNIDAVNMQPTIQPEKEQLSCEGTTKGTTSDLISRQAAIDALAEALKQIGVLDIEDVGLVLSALPAAQLEPHEGYWINGKCDLCGEHAPFWAMASTYHESKYCPNCGAKMKGERQK